MSCEACCEISTGLLTMECLSCKFSRACEVSYEFGSCCRHRLTTVPLTPPVAEQGLPRPGSWRLVIRLLIITKV